MKYYIFLCFLAMLGWFAFRRSLADRKQAREDRRFWSREEEANATRRQDISQLPYIRLSLDELPLNVCSYDETLSRCDREVCALAEKQILNLTGFTNTDLKLKYGAPNLPILSECDENFTQLARLLQEWGNRLYELSYRNEAEQVLSSAVRFGSDIKGTYTLLASIYQENHNEAGFLQLKQYAKLLNSLQKEPILRALDAMDAYRDAFSL